MIIVIDYGIGNLGSVLNILKKVRADAKVSSRPEDIAAADRLILPGVGAFDHGMASLDATGLVPVLRQRVLDDGVPLLGICLGMQLLTRGSEEGARAGLGWLDARTVRFAFGSQDGARRVPHIGWANVNACESHPLFGGLDRARFYFVHSYHVVAAGAATVLAIAEYGIQFTAAIAKQHIMGVQFHPERSHRFGMQLFRNFLAQHKW